MADIDITEVMDEEIEAAIKESATERRDRHAVEDLDARLENVKKGSELEKKLMQERERLLRQQRMSSLEEQIDKEEDAQKRLILQDKLAEEERAQKREEAAKKNSEFITQQVMSTLNSVTNAIAGAAKEYGSYIDKIQVRLLGANETVGSITDKMQQAFGASPIFQMKTVMEKVSQAVEKGINFNIESRAAMEVLKDKVAATFDAFDSSLLRIVRIQQQDSTQARLGMEAMLTEFLNKQFQDSSYLANSINSQVTQALVEAESRLDRADAVQFEYAIQKWLGSMSSVGVSNELVNKLAQGLGYLASGDVASLSGQAELESLLVASANRGGANYGQMLTNGVSVDDINAIFTGLRYLVEEIGNNGHNIVALNQYAKTFGMTVSDIQSMLNLGDEALAEISSGMSTMSELQQKVKDEASLAKLLSRTGGASIGENLYQNFLFGSGEFYGKTAAGYLGWQMGGIVTELLKGLETGVDIQPFGVGTHMNLDVGKLAEVVRFTAGVLPGITGMLSGIGSIGGVNFRVLGDDNEEARGIVKKGSLLSMTQTGKQETSTTYVGDYSEGSLAKTASGISDDAITEHTDESFDEEKKKTEESMKAMKEIGDNVKFIVQLLNESGIVVRGRYGYTEPAEMFSETLQAVDTNGASIIGVRPV